MTAAGVRLPALCLVLALVLVQAPVAGIWGLTAPDAASGSTPSGPTTDAGTASRGSATGSGALQTDRSTSGDRAGITPSSPATTAAAGNDAARTGGGASPSADGSSREAATAAPDEASENRDATGGVFDWAGIAPDAVGLADDPAARPSGADAGDRGGGPIPFDLSGAFGGIAGASADDRDDSAATTTGSTAGGSGTADGAGSRVDAADRTGTLGRNGSTLVGRPGAVPGGANASDDDGANASDDDGANASDDDGANASDDGVNDSLAAAVRADEVHERGVTGEGVRIGVVGAAFDSTDPAIADRVASHERLAPDTNAAHDTAVAEIASETAPGSSLFLVGVGDSPTPETYQQGIAWLLANDVDVIVDSGSYFPRTVAGSDRITAAAENATAQGVAFVTSAGNYADRHWAGRGAAAGWVQFAPGAEATFLADGKRISGPVSLRLRWNGTADYDLYLYRQLPGDDPVVAESTRSHDPNGTRRAEAIDVAVPEGRYYVAIRSSGTPDPGTVRLFSPRVGIQYATSEGALAAPAPGDGVIAVGALGDGGTTANYSSTGGDRVAVDVVAPGSAHTAAAGEFVGTSAAAPYAAGTAALMTEANANLTPRVVEGVLRVVSAERGRLDALAAVSAVSANDSFAPNATAIRVAENGTVTALPANATFENGSLATASGNATSPASPIENATADAGNETRVAGNETRVAGNKRDDAPNATGRTEDDAPSGEDSDAHSDGSSDEGEADGEDAAAITAPVRRP